MANEHRTLPSGCWRRLGADPDRDLFHPNRTIEKEAVAKAVRRDGLSLLPNAELYSRRWRNGDSLPTRPLIDSRIDSRQYN